MDGTRPTARHHKSCPHSSLGCQVSSQPVTTQIRVSNACRVTHIIKDFETHSFSFQRKRKFPLSPRFPPKLRPRSLPVPWIRTRLPFRHHSQWQEMIYRTQHKWVNRSSTSHPIFFSILKLIHLYTSIVDWYCLPGYPRIFPRCLNKLWIININIIIKIWSNWNLTSMQKIKYGNSNQSEQIF